MNWLKSLMFWRRPKPVLRGNVSELVQKALENPETQAKIASNIVQHNALLRRMCKHDWQVEEGQDLLHMVGVPWFVCAKCGKRENTI